MRIPIFLVLAWLTAILQFAPAAGAKAGFDHGLWNQVLTRYVDGQGKVNYSALKQTPGQLDAYLRQLAGVDPATFADDHERIAFWINAYNAVTIRQVLDHYPIGSVRDVGFLYGFFRQANYPVAGKKRTLDEIEGILRQDFREPRIHFTIVCASASCPRLQNKAYSGATLTGDLDRVTREFLRDSFRNRWDPSSRTLNLSSIFKWYSKDFEPLGGVVGFIRPYLDKQLLQQLDAGKFTVQYLPYDWSLNDQQAKR